MKNILIDELKNSLLAITGTGVGIAAKQLLLMKWIGLTATGWGGLGLAAGGISTLVMNGYKAYKGLQKEADLEAAEVAKIERFAKALNELKKNIVAKEEELDVYRELADSTDPQEALENARLAVKCANELDELYEGMDELNIANPVSKAEASPAIEGKYFICEEQRGICNKAGKIKTDKVWGDIESCCTEAPMEDVMIKLENIENIEDEINEIYVFNDTINTKIDTIKTKIDDLEKKIESNRGGGSLIRKIKNKSKRNKTKRNKTNRKLTKTNRKLTKRNKTKRNKTKRKLTKIKKTKRKINKY